MYIRGLIPRNFTELVEAVPINITIWIPQSMYQNNHSQMLAHAPVKITIVNIFQNLFWFCMQ